MNSDRANVPEDLIAAAIDAAEDFLDPLEALVEKTATDAGVPFEPDVLERLAALKNDDRAAFEALRAQLKKGRLSGHRARQGHRRRKWRHRQTRAHPGRHSDRTRESC